ncbi:MAG: thioredoxin family protein [Planctomycetota bacterium]
MLTRFHTLITVFFLTLFSANPGQAEIAWETSPANVIAKSRESGKPILVFVSARWCHYCQKMKQDTWADPRVDVAVSQGFETLVLDGDQDSALVRPLGLRGFPATLIYTPDGRFISQQGGYLPPQRFLKWLDELRSASTRLNR